MAEAELCHRVTTGAAQLEWEAFGGALTWGEDVSHITYHRFQSKNILK